MKKGLFITILLGIFSVAQVQGQAPKGHGKISGVVVDPETKQPVEFANVALMDPKTGKPVDGAVCDEKGKFSITKVEEGTYSISVSFIGYETVSIPNVIITQKNDNIELGEVKLSTGAKMLNEIVVEGQKQLVEERVDRTVYNAENDQTTRGGDATDVLKRVPLLSVDLDGNVSLRGNSNLRVLINNKPSTISASSVADALKQIPADQIKSVEVITSPSAKYDAEGSAGIINIITKKNTLQGATLNVNAGAGLRGSNLGLNGSYRKGKMGFTLGGFGRAGYNITGAFHNDQATQSGGVEKTTLQSADTRGNNLFGRYTLGWDYDINKYNSISASARYGVRNGNNFQNGLLTETYEGSTLINSSLRDVNTTDNSGTVDLNLDYTRTFEKPQRELSFSTQFSRNNRTNNFFNTIFGTDEDIASRLKNINKSFNQEVTVQVDYMEPISTKQLLEVGAKNITRRVSSDYKYYQATGADGDYSEIQNANASNIFNYNQNISAGYLSYTVTLPKSYSLKAGARYEYTTITANFENPTETTTEIPSYGVLVPSANISKKLSNGNTLKAAYNRRIQRPSIQYLNPNIQASNPLYITIGNPNLQPEYTNNYELSYSTYIKSTSLNFSGFVRNTTGAIQSVREVVEGTGAIQTTYHNIGQEDAYGLSLFSSVNVGSKLTLNGGTDVYYAILNNNVADPLYHASNQGWVANARLFGNYSLTKGWGFQFFGFYRGRQVQLQGTQGGFGTYSLGLKKDFDNKKGSFGFGADNFITPVIRIHNNVTSPTIDQHSVSDMHYLSFRVNVSYRIGKMSFDAPRKRKKSISNEDLKEGGGDNGGGQDMNQGQTQGQGGFMPGRNVSADKTKKKRSKGGDEKEPEVKADPSAEVKAEGNWNYTLESPQGGSGKLIIKKDGDTYSGSIINSRMNRENQLKSVTVNGNELTFTYEVNFNGNTQEIVVKGIITGDQFAGTSAFGQFGSSPFKATRTE